MRRRSFLCKTAAGTAVAGLGALGISSCSQAYKRHLTILHTNDVHSHIEPFPKGHATFPDLGGVARRAALIDQIRQENPHTLLLDAGDIFQGTPYFNFYGGELEFKLMTMMRYDAATIGNHDFDNGIEGLLAQVPNAGFQLLSANYDFSNTIMEGHVKPYTIFLLDGLRIGVFGLGIALAGLVTPSLFKETVYLEPVEIAQDISSKLKIQEKCDLVICLSHLGHTYANNPMKPNDLQLASKTDHIDLIIGGHTHTFLKKPVIVRNRKNEQVLVNQAGCYGVNLGRIDFYFDSYKRRSAEGVGITV